MSDKPPHLAVNIDGLIGDSILQEPALSAWATQHYTQVDAYVCPFIRPLFLHHPYIRLVDKPIPDGCTLLCTEAMAWALQNGLPFASGYFHQIGLAVGKNDRLKFRIFSSDYNLCSVPNDRYIVIVPFARSATAFLTDHCNRTVPIIWWELLVKRLPYPVVSFGGVDDPPIFGTENYRGTDLLSTAHIMKGCTIYIGIETGLTHLAEAVCQRVVFLSSALPEWLLKPDVWDCRVVRAARPIEWSRDEVVSHVEDMIEKL